MEPCKGWAKMDTLRKMLWGSSKTEDEYHTRLMSALEYQRVHTSEVGRMYCVVRVNDRTGERINMTATPCTHAEACVILSKISNHPQYPHLRTILEEME